MYTPDANSSMIDIEVKLKSNAHHRCPTCKKYSVQMYGSTADSAAQVHLFACSDPQCSYMTGFHGSTLEAYQEYISDSRGGLPRQDAPETPQKALEGTNSTAQALVALSKQIASLQTEIQTLKAQVNDLVRKHEGVDHAGQIKLGSR